MDEFNELEKNVSDAIDKFVEKSNIHLLSVKAQDEAEAEWNRLVSLELLTGERLDNVIAKLSITPRGKELNDMIRIRRADANMSRQSYNSSMFDVEFAILKARWATIRTERR